MIPSYEHVQEVDAIRNLLEGWARAVRERDVPGILANHSAEILMFDVPPPFLSKGIEAYRKTWDLFFAESNYVGIFDVDTLEITVGGDVAFATALMHCGTPDGNEPGGQLRFRLTVGLRKVGGKWTVLHEHHSIPAV
jgi:ketosteroid isomerase-like protein